MQEILYIVVPCYNEEEVLPETTKRLTEKLNSLIKEELISSDSKVLYVNDGSKDLTWSMIKEMHEKDSIITGMSLTRNKGHQNALLAGLMEAKEHADMIISMDADLQDDIDVIEDFIKAYYDGNEIVYGVRNSRKTDSFFKRTTAQTFYRFLNLMGVEVVYNHADYRLMSKRAVCALEEYKEVNLFLRGIIPMLGFKTTTVEYGRGKRFAGKSKYNLYAMFYLAMDGITSTTVRPIRMITMLGFITAIVSAIVLVYVIFGHFFGATVSGWTSTIVCICLFGGLQIFSIGVVGEYVGKIYLETKGRPRYIVDEILN